jgi:D-aspartate ligase
MGQAGVPGAVVLGGGVNGLGVARSLGRQGIPVTLVEADRNDLANKSRYVSSFLPADADDDRLLESLMSLSSGAEGPPVLLYTSDRFLKFVSEYRDALASRFRFVIANVGSIFNVVDKAGFEAFADCHGFPTPRTLSIGRDVDCPEAMEQLQFPVLIKPTLSYEWRTERFAEQFGSAKVLAAGTHEELRSLLSRLKDHSSDLVIQEIIVGDDDAHYSVVSYRSPEFGELTRLTVQKLRVWPVRNGAGSLCRITSNTELESISRSVLDALEWVGTASVCFKIDRRTQRPMIHEVNGRLPQWHACSRTVNLDLPYLMYRDALQQPPAPLRLTNPARNYRILSMDCAALMATLRSGALTRKQALRELLRPDLVAEFSRDDWRPAVTALAGILPTVIKGLAFRPPATQRAVTT